MLECQSSSNGEEGKQLAVEGRLPRISHYFGFSPFVERENGSWILRMKLRDLRFMKTFFTSKRVFRARLAHKLVIFKGLLKGPQRQ